MPRKPYYTFRQFSTPCTAAIQQRVAENKVYELTPIDRHPNAIRGQLWVHIPVDSIGKHDKERLVMEVLY